jgi:5'-methylthioadenosine phosphorylase
VQIVDYGIIGGSGLYAMEGFEVEERVLLETPFGQPSDAFIVGRLGDCRVAFLPRHGEGHRLLPTEINFRANIYGFKLLQAQAILSASAVGSLHERYRPGDILVPDQLVDRTRHREDTFFGDGIVAHVGFAEPFCPTLRDRLVATCRELGLIVHPAGTYLCMEGPLFSTRGESFLYRSWGMDVIGMTNLQEAKLAREAEICYATLALVTDYDCWHSDFASVQIEDVLRILAENSQHAQAVLRRVASESPPNGTCDCHRALENAVITRRDIWPESTVQRLRPLLNRFLDGNRGGCG